MSYSMKSYASAILEATDYALKTDASVYLMGLGVPDPKGIFGTTSGLAEKYPGRILDMPCAENGMTGIALGSALAGMRPILTHQRIDFALLALEQMVNQAAKWNYMFGAQKSVPMVIRLIVGRGWGQGPQHSQALQSWFAHIPGLKVVMPTTAYDAKGLLLASIQDPNPVIFIEHRWLHHIQDNVPDEAYTIPLGKARLLREGNDITLVSYAYMSIEALTAAAYLEKEGIEVEIVDLRTIRPLDYETIITSVQKTGHLVALETSWQQCSVASDVISQVAISAFSHLKKAPQILACAECPCPTTPALSALFYPTSREIVQAVMTQLGRSFDVNSYPMPVHADVPNAAFKGPF